MLDVLSRILGPGRAVSVYVFFTRFGVAIACVLGFAAILAFLFLRPSGEPEHEAYLRVPVLSSEPLSTADQIGVSVMVQLPDGQNLRLTETEGLIARSITDSACIERRRRAGADAPLYRLRLPHRCDG